ncbi:hypothetical protein [Streptomyces sp. HUAS TT20]|uniref:hypothetical protein n=1 Tax=Streptomyces sp. HUAS TT20 TaxID=3447509 RepID=UPI0021D828A3|nr:hypothetical protein [Streptomyces sp. HUAS 15-9]UXY32172.1 hypothetical protein N8I87_40355 [Streptomyces sp. HUAS 15-9]
MFVNDGMFAVSDDAEEPVETARWSNGLAAPMEYGAWILTGINTGNVRVRAEVLDAAPSVDTASWDEIVEISVQSVLGDLRIHSGYEITPDNLPVLNPRGPDWYRMRVHARGRSVNPDGVSQEPVEDYLITIWPREQAASEVLRTSERIEEALRISAGETPGKPQPRPDQEPAPKPAAPATAERARLLRHLKRD